jgi:gamma-glutamylcysteine synthetase
MADQNQNQENRNPADPWQEVGQQFKNLGDSLASALRQTWQSEETRQHVDKLQTELSSAAEQISAAVKNTLNSEESAKLKSEMGKAAQSAQATGQEVYEQVRPELLSAFRTVRSELDRLISRLDPPPAAAEKKDE